MDGDHVPCCLRVLNLRLNTHLHTSISLALVTACGKTKRGEGLKINFPKNFYYPTASFMPENELLNPYLSKCPTYLPLPNTCPHPPLHAQETEVLAVQGSCQSWWVCTCNSSGVHSDMPKTVTLRLFKNQKGGNNL